MTNVTKLRADYIRSAAAYAAERPYGDLHDRAAHALRTARVGLLGLGELTADLAAAACCAGATHVSTSPSERRAAIKAIAGDSPPRGTLMRVEEAATLRASRVSNYNTPGPFSPPVSERWHEMQIRAAYRAAGYRRATHGHRVAYYTASEVTARSSVDHERPSKLGLSNSYAKKAFFVTLSAHDIVVRSDWCGAVRARGAAVVGGMLTLDLFREPDASVPGGRAYKAVWIEQARGTALNVVRGWLVRTERGWVHADTARGAARLSYDATPTPSPSPRSTKPLPTDAPGLLRRARLSGDEVVIREHATDAGHCHAGIRDWLAKHGLSNRDQITARELAETACASGDRLREVYLVLLATARTVRSLRRIA